MATIDSGAAVFSPGSPGTRLNATLFTRVGLVAVVGVLTAYLAQVAVTTRVEQFDGYVYLNNAKRLLELPPGRYEHVRPPLLSLAMLAPVAMAARGEPAGDGYFVWPHLAALLVSLLSALAVGQMLRRFLGTTLALGGVALFVSSRLFIRYGPYVMADLLSAGMAALVLTLYQRTRADGQTSPRWRDYRLCGLALGLAMLAKYPLGLILPALALAEVLHGLHQRRWDGRRLLGLVLIGALAGLLFLAVQLTICAWLYGPHAFEAAAHIAKYQFSPRSLSNRLAANAAPGSALDYASLAWHTLSPTVVVAGAIGLVLALGQRQARDLTPLAWLIVVGGAIVFLIGEREARYLLPVVPVWLYFALRAVEAAVGLARRLWSRGRGLRILVTALLCLAIAPVVCEAAVQLRLQSDAFYTADSQRQIVRSLVAARGPGGQLRWFGTLATFHPTRRATLLADPYFDVFQADADSCEYFLRESIVPVERIGDLDDGDAVLKAPDTLYRTRSIPAAGVPLPVVWVARTLRPSGEAGALRLQSPDGALSARLLATPPYLVVQPQTSFGRWHTYVKQADGRLIGGELLDLRAGAAASLGPYDGAPVASLLLMRAASPIAASAQ